MRYFGSLVLMLMGVVWAGDDPGLSKLAAVLDVPGVAAPRPARALPANRTPAVKSWGGPLTFQPLDGGAGRSPVATTGYVACNAEYLFILVRCGEPDMKQVSRTPVRRDGNVWQADSVEIMVLPGLDAKGTYTQFAVNPAGSLFDARGHDKAWNSRARVTTFFDAKSWTVLLRIPLADFGPVRSPFWRLNLHRYRPGRAGAPAQDLAWSPTFTRSNHVPTRFGLLYLAGAEQPVDFAAAIRKAETLQAERVVFKTDFNQVPAGIAPGAVVTAQTPAGPERFLRATNVRKVLLDRNFGDIHGLKMAFAYRTAAHQHGLVVQGVGTAKSGARPGIVNVVGRGLKVARQTCHDADGQSRALDLGLDAFEFRRPYGH